MANLLVKKCCVFDNNPEELAENGKNFNSRALSMDLELELALLQFIRTC